MKEPLLLSDAVLARRWQAGDSQASALVVARYANTLGAVAYGVLNDASQADDVVQETFVRAAQQIRTLRDGEKLGPFLIGIARNVSVDIVRKRTREVGLQSLDPPARDDPRLDASRAELRARLRAAVGRLPVDQREIFMLKYVSDMKYSEIAVILGITARAVGQKLWRIRKKLQAELEDLMT